MRKTNLKLGHSLLALGLASTLLGGSSVPSQARKSEKCTGVQDIQNSQSGQNAQNVQNSQNVQNVQSPASQNSQKSLNSRNSLNSQTESINGTPQVSEQRLGNKTFAVGSVTVNAHAEKIWQILTDYNNAPDIFSNLQKCEVVVDKGANKLVRQLVHPKGTPIKLDYIVAIKETAPTLMEWHRQSGALKEVVGSWRLEPNQETGTTRVTYSIYIDGGLLLPAWLLRGQSKNYLPELLQAVKQASEHKDTTAQTSSQIKRG